MKYCICGEVVESHVTFHWLTTEEGHYVNDEKARAKENRDRLEVERNGRAEWPVNLQRAGALFGSPPNRAPAFLAVPLKRLWTPEDNLRRAGNAVMRDLGYAVYDLEQGYRKDGSSRQTVGIGDCYFIGDVVQGWIEYKRWDNEPSQAQYAFAREVLEAGGIYLLVYDTYQLATWHQWEA
jgi:hypothetical protein